MVSGYDRKLPTLGLDALYDYFSNIGMHHHSDRFENQRWIEINTIISSRNGISPEKRILLKTIGVLNLLSSLPGIVASEDMIHATLFTNYYKKKSLVKSMLHDLVQEKILLFRGYAREYRLWEGSDFELDREVLEARGRVALRPVSETLEEMASRPRLVAARHSFQTGTLREFAVRWCTEDNLSSVKENPRAKDDGDGTIWLMLGRGRMPGNLSEITKSDCPVIIGHAPCLEQVRQLMLEAAACQEACNAPQLERDGVARREARYRAAQATQSVLTFLDEVFSPGTGSALWFAEGKLAEIHNQQELSALASDLCDRIYYQCPHQ